MSMIRRKLTQLIQEWRGEVNPTGDGAYDNAREQTYRACANAIDELLENSHRRHTSQPKKLIKRTDPRNLNPKNCCFIFGIGDEKSYFRIYHRERGERGDFTDYRIAGGVTPFVKFDDDDVELKEYRLADGSIDYVMDFPEHVLSGKLSVLGPGEVWESKD